MKKVEKLAEDIRRLLEIHKGDSLLCFSNNIKSTLDKHAPIKKPFPKAMVTNEGKVVWFSEPNNGTVLIKANDNGDDDSVGCGSRFWCMEDFRDCEIELKK